ncbi:MAG: glycerophosphodiester phosphodiesterase [Dehalococcoidia bacterium]
MPESPVITRLRPVAIVHRAGNDLEALRAAEAAGIDLVECDLWPYRGHVEVRHLKTFGNVPIPLLWDRKGWTHWWLAPGWRPRLRLRGLLAARGPHTELMLDLKGHDGRLSRAVLDAYEATEEHPPLTVCSQSWELLDPFRDHEDIAVVHSVGSLRQLRRLAAQPDVSAVSIDRRLLSRPVAEELHARGCFVMTWSVETWPQAEMLLDVGADGIISSDLEVLRRVMALRAAPAAPADDPT